MRPTLNVGDGEGREAPSRWLQALDGLGAGELGEVLAVKDSAIVSLNKLAGSCWLGRGLGLNALSMTVRYAALGGVFRCEHTARRG